MKLGNVTQRIVNTILKHNPKVSMALVPSTKKADGSFQLDYGL